MGGRRQQLPVTDSDAWLYMVPRAFGSATGTKDFDLSEMRPKLGQQKEKAPPRCDPPPEFPATVVAQHALAINREADPRQAMANTAGRNMSVKGLGLVSCRSHIPDLNFRRRPLTKEQCNLI